MEIKLPTKKQWKKYFVYRENLSNEMIDLMFSTDKILDEFKEERKKNLKEVIKKNISVINFMKKTRK